MTASLGCGCSCHLFSLAILKEQAPTVKTAPVSKGTLTTAEGRVFCHPGAFSGKQYSRGYQALCGSVVVLENYRYHGGWLCAELARKSVTYPQTESLTGNLRCLTYSRSLLLWDQGSKTIHQSAFPGVTRFDSVFESGSLSFWNGHRTSSQTHPSFVLLALLSALISFCTSCGPRALLDCISSTSDYWKQGRRGAGPHRLW